MNEELKQQLDSLLLNFNNHNHNGVNSKQTNVVDLFGNIPANMQSISGTITTTGNTDIYMIAPISGALISADFSCVEALAASDVNYITFSITNLGQSGSGSTAMLGAVNGNTTKTTGGTAISGDTKRVLILSTAINATKVDIGDRLRIRAAATGTLANTLNFPVYMLRFR